MVESIEIKNDWNLINTEKEKLNKMKDICKKDKEGFWNWLNSVLPDFRKFFGVKKEKYKKVIVEQNDDNTTSLKIKDCK